MADSHSDYRSPPGNGETNTNLAGVGFSWGQPGAIALYHVFRAVRLHLPLFVGLALLTGAVALFGFRAPFMYRATAVLRLAGERRAVSAAMDQPPPAVDRATAPTLSLVPLIRSRALVGAVVDSLGLQVRPVPDFSRWLLTRAPSLSTLRLQVLRVNRSASWDTLYVRFDPSNLLVYRDNRWEPQPYRSPVTKGSVSFMVPAQPEAVGVALAVVPRDRAIDAVLERLAAVPLPGTDAIEVKYSDPDPLRAQRVANFIAQTFQSANVHSSQEQAKRRRVFFAERLNEIDSLLAQAQANLSGFRSQRRLASSADELASQQAARAALDSRRAELEANRRVYQSLLSQLQQGSDSTKVEALQSLAYSPEIATDPIVGGLYQQVLLYRLRLDSLTTGPWRSSPTNPDVVQARDLLRSSQQELVRAVRGHLNSLDERSELLTALRNSNASQMRTLPALQAEEKRLDQHVAALYRQADQLRLEYQGARMSEELAAGDIEIVDLAAVPYRPLGVPWWLKVGLAGLLGIVVGTGVSVLLEMRDHSIRVPEELEQVLQIRGLAVIPRVADSNHVRSGWAHLRHKLTQHGVDVLPDEIVADSRWPSVSAEAFRLLYSSLTHGWRNGTETRTILVTSVAPQEGKTLVAANLAVTFAREGARVLLVDCDLRRPRLHTLFKAPRAPGLTNLMRVIRPPLVEPMDNELARDQQPPEGSFSLFPGMQRPVEYDSSQSAVESTPEGPAQLQPAATPQATKAPPGATNGKTAASAGVGVTSPTPMPAEDRFPELRRTAVERLFLLPCGELPPNPAEALKVARVQAVLNELAPDFDLIVLDTPPVLVSADAAVLAPIPDDVLMVVRAGQTDVESASLAYHQLAAAGAPVTGAVLNDPEGEVEKYRRLYYSYDDSEEPD